jgi:diguanylate cyclase (GGDEF)-like protein/PAS domain S-box-containing protein
VRISVIRNAAGEVVGFSASLTDISERKVAQQAVSTSEERYRTVFETSPDAVMITRLCDEVILDANQSFLDSAGFERREIIGRTPRELGIWVNERDRQMLIDTLSQKARIRDMEVLSRKKNGEIFWMRLSASTIDIGGVPCRLSFAKDITEVKAAEEHMATAQRALRTSEERYRTVFQTSQDGIAITRMSDGKWIDANSALLDLLGYEYDELLGRTTSELNIWVDPNERAEWVGVLQRASVFRDITTRLRKKSGEVFWSLLSSSLILVDGDECIMTVVRDISEAKAAEEEIRDLAFYDTLTGVANRRLASERLHRAIVLAARANRKGGLLFIDIDHFKQLNDTLGHKAGDVLLKEVARRLKQSVRESDTVGRFAGDEFVVVLHDLSEHAEEAGAQMQAIAEKILKSIRHPCLIEGHETVSSCSIGITLFGNHDDSVDNILQQADIAMYQAKAAGRNVARFFAPALQASVIARAALEEDLRQAIRLNQFELYYQPQFDRDGLVGAEALIRWNHSSRGVVLPDEFIPLAEETGLILDIGNWVLETACAQIAGLAQCEQCANIAVAVNISAIEFRQPDLVERVLSAVFSSNANPRHLKLELTESMLVDNLADVIGKMTELKANGIKFSLDDFGTGYSSLSYLKRLPLDQLKIDRSFVRDMLEDDTSRAIARTIISLSKAMGLSVIAEGVETEEQREFLARHGCFSYQGYLFGRPAPFEEFQELCRALPGKRRERLSVTRSGRR